MKRRNLVQRMALSGLALVASALLGQTGKSGDTPVTAVEGQSWIRHIRKTFNETSMGKTWSLGPAPAAPGESAPAWQMKITPEYATQITMERTSIA